MTWAATLFARVFQGGRVSLTIGIVGAVVASVVGSIYGGIASYFGGIVDDHHDAYR